MIAGQIVAALLTGNAPVTALAGNRIFANVDPQEAAGYPNVVFYSSGVDRLRTLEGVVGDCTTDHIKILIQARDYKAMVDLGEAVATAMQIQRQTIAGFVVQGIFFDDEDESEQNISDLGEDFIVQVKEQTYRVIFDLP